MDHLQTTFSSSKVSKWCHYLMHLRPSKKGGDVNARTEKVLLSVHSGKKFENNTTTRDIAQKCFLRLNVLKYRVALPEVKFAAHCCLVLFLGFGAWVCGR